MGTKYQTIVRNKLPLRHIINQEDKDLMIQMYKEKNSIEYIAKTLRYPITAVRGIIMKYTGNYLDRIDIKKKKISFDYEDKDPISVRVVKMSKRGYTDEQIAANLKIAETMVKKILRAEINSGYDYAIERQSVRNISKFADEVKIGEKYSIRYPFYKDKASEDFFSNPTKSKIVEVLKKYKYIVMTDQGCFSYIDLFFGQKVQEK